MHRYLWEKMDITLKTANFLRGSCNWDVVDFFPFLSNILLLSKWYHNLPGVYWYIWLFTGVNTVRVFTWECYKWLGGKAVVVFAGYCGSLHHLQLSSYEIAAICQKSWQKRNSEFLIFAWYPALYGKKSRKKKNYKFAGVTAEGNCLLLRRMQRELALYGFVAETSLN